MRVAIVTLDNHLTGAVGRVSAQLAREAPGLDLTVHAASNWAASPDSLKACIEDIGSANIVIATMLFMEDHIQAVMPALQARRESCDAMVCFMSAGEVIKLTRLGRFNMGGSQGPIISLLKKLRGAKTNNATEKATAGEKQLAMLKRLPKILRFIPGSAQDVRAYFLAMQYWLAGSEENIGNLVRFLVAKFADGPRKGLRQTMQLRRSEVLSRSRRLSSAACLPHERERREASLAAHRAQGHGGPAADALLCAFGRHGAL